MVASANAEAFLLLVAAFILAVSTTTSARLNITKVLSKYPEYSTLSSLFNQTKLIPAINKRQTITILALDNDAIRSISSRESDELRKILMNHVILDYYDRKKIRNMKTKSVILTTMYQSTGEARDEEGFVKMTKRKPGDVVFGSAEKGAPMVSKLLGSVVFQPFNFSVLQVSLAIVAPDFGDPVAVPPPPPGESSKSPAEAPNKSKSGDAPSPSDEEEVDDGEAADSPSPSPSDGPAGAPKAAKAKSPSNKDAAADEEEDPDQSASSRILWSRVGVAAMIGLVATLVAF